VQSLDKNGAAIELAVAVGVLEDDDAIFPFALLGSLGIGVGLGNPEPASMIDGESDWLLHIRFAGEESRLESWRENHLARGSLGREPRELDHVRRRDCFGCSGRASS